MLILGNSTFPFNIERVSLFVCIGAMLKNWKYFKERMRFLFSFPGFRLIILYTLYIGFVSYSDNFKFYFFSFLPSILVPIILPALFLIKKEKYYSLFNILFLCLLLHCLAVILNYYDIFSVPKILEATFVQEYEGELKNQSKYFMRSGYFRVNGISAGVISESYYLATLSVLSMMYLLNLKTLIFSFIVLVSIIFTGTRTAIFGYFIGIVLFITLNNFQSAGLKAFYPFIKKSLILLILISFIILPSLKNIVDIDQIVNNIYISTFLMEGEGSIEAKVLRLPIALDLFFSKPIFGYNISPKAVYMDLMNSGDLPTPFIMLLSGGIALFMIWLLFFLQMVFDIYKERKNNYLSNIDYNYYNISIVMISIGFLTQFSHHEESHIPILIMVYISTIIWSNFNESNIKI